MINKTQDVPNFLEECKQDLAPYGSLACEILDIEGCYPNMPKDAIRVGLRDAANEMRALGRLGVWVPKAATSKPCSWKPVGKHAKVWLPFEAMHERVVFPKCGAARVKIRKPLLICNKR